MTSPTRESVVGVFATRGGATTVVHRTENGSLHGVCGGCGEYEWPLNAVTTLDRAREHADRCQAAPRPVDA